MSIPADWKMEVEWLGDGTLKYQDPRGICPWCRVPSTFLIRASVVLPQPRRTANTSIYQFHLILQCNSVSCSKTSYAYLEVSSIMHPNRLETLNLDHQNGEFFTYPLRGIAPKHPAIPAAVAEDWVEAQKAMQAGAPKAAAVMCRRVLYGAILDKKCKPFPLMDGVKQLIAQERLPSIFDNWLTAIKDDGHDAAHPDRALQIDPTNVAETIEYTSELLRFLYIEPHEFQKRLARKANP
jgi:hypothetical protein